jgi:transcriptional regulator with XRE-family HTH domain
MPSGRDLSHEVGLALRRARKARGLTLRQVGLASQGRFKSTAVAGYERAERSITLERFYELARLYDMVPERLLSQIAWRVGGGPEPVIDPSKIVSLPPKEQGALVEFISQVRQMRGTPDEGTISLRVRDLEVLATISGTKLDEFVEHLRPALVRYEPGS